MAGRQPRRWLRAGGRGAGLLLLAGILSAAGLWSNRAFAESAGPVRHLDPRLVVWASLGALGLLLILWVVAIARRRSGAPGGGS